MSDAEDYMRRFGVVPALPSIPKPKNPAVQLSKLWRFAEEHGPSLAPYVDHDGTAQPDALRADLRVALTTMSSFCDRVEAGTIRSTRTYAQFCTILGRAPRK